MVRDRAAASPPTPWSKLLRRTAILLAIWFLVGPVLGILLVEPLNELTLGGVPLGFWVSQQGSIYVFILLIFAYAVMGDRADRGDRGHPADRDDQSDRADRGDQGDRGRRPGRPDGDPPGQRPGAAGSGGTEG